MFVVGGGHRPGECLSLLGLLYKSLVNGLARKNRYLQLVIWQDESQGLGKALPVG